MGFLSSNIDCMNDPTPKDSSWYDNDYIKRCIRCPTPPDIGDWDYKKPEETKKFRTLRKMFTIRAQPKLRSLFKRKESSGCTLTERYSGEDGYSRLIQDMDSISGTLTIRSTPKQPEGLKSLFKVPSRRGSTTDLASQYSNPYERDEWDERDEVEEASVKKSRVRRFFKRK